MLSIFGSRESTMPEGIVSNSRSNDRELVAAALQGDKKAFTSLVKIHDSALRSMVTGVLADRNLVDDVLQDAYIKAYRSLGTFKQSSSFKTWLFRIAYNAAIDEIRRSKNTNTMGSMRCQLQAFQPKIQYLIDLT